MPFKIVRNDITRMHTEAIVNTANEAPVVGPGCDAAVYQAAGYEKLLAYRKEKIGDAAQGEVFLTPGFDLPARYIIHAVSPLFQGGGQQEEEKLRACYQKSLALADAHGIRSVSFPLISTGGYGYPKEEGMRIAVDEIHAFLLTHEMMVYLVVFDDKAAQMGKNLAPDLEAYIDRNYVEQKQLEEYGKLRMSMPDGEPDRRSRVLRAAPMPDREELLAEADPAETGFKNSAPFFSVREQGDEFFEELDRKLAQRMEHLSDTFAQYLMYLIRSRGMDNAQVYKRAIIDKKVFSKIKNNPDYHPQKLTALCLCVGARLNLDETKDLLARAGYALSPCDKTDVIFSYFIENGIYDMVELDIQLEEHGLPCVIR